MACRCVLDKPINQHNSSHGLIAASRKCNRVVVARQEVSGVHCWGTMVVNKLQSSGKL